MLVMPVWAAVTATSSVLTVIPVPDPTFNTGTGPLKLVPVKPAPASIPVKSPVADPNAINVLPLWYFSLLLSLVST